MDNLSDQLQAHVFRHLSNLEDFRNCRKVSQKWKRIVTYACRNKYHVAFPLTDSTLYTANRLRSALVSFDIYSFTGKKNKDAWQASGIELLMRTTEWLQFSGSEVNLEEIRKILGLAKDTLKTLSFRCFKRDLTNSLLQTQETFRALRKIGYYNNETNDGTFNTFTNTLEKWTSLDCRVQAPLIESLNLYFDYRSGVQYGHPGYRLGRLRFVYVKTEVI